MLLDELNLLLAKNKNALHIPEHRCQVGNSGNNLVWLRKTLTKNKDTPKEILELLSKTVPELTRN